MDWNKLKEWNDFDVMSFLLPDYKINKWIFRASLAVIVVIGLLILWGEGFDFSSQIYMKCPNTSIGPCENPFYLQYPCPQQDLCDFKSLMPGESFGKDYSGLVGEFKIVIWVVIFLSLFINHFFYNWGYFKANKKKLWKRFQKSLEEEHEDNNKGKD